MCSIRKSVQCLSPISDTFFILSLNCHFQEISTFYVMIFKSFESNMKGDVVRQTLFSIVITSLLLNDREVIFELMVVKRGLSSRLA